MLGFVDQAVGTPADRVVASAVVAVLWLGAVAVLRRTHGPARERFGAVVATGAATLLLLGVTAVTGAVLVTVWGASPGFQTALGDLEAGGWLLGARAVLTVVLLVGIYVVTRIVQQWLYRLGERRQGVSRHQVEIGFRTGQVILYAFGLMIVLSVWGVSLGGLLVGAGFLGIVVGMAARQTLGALLAGFVLMFSRPFEIGDWVEVGDNEGVVTDITIVNTRIQTFDGEYVMVPNDLVAAREVVNRSRKGRLRLTLEIGVDYDTDVDHAIETATDALSGVDQILSVPQPQVVAKSFGDSAIVLEGRVWIDKPSARRKWRAQTAAIRAVKAAFDREGITIPFPQRELSRRSGASGITVDDPPATTGGEDRD